MPGINTMLISALNIAAVNWVITCVLLLVGWDDCDEYRWWLERNLMLTLPGHWTVVIVIWMLKISGYVGINF